MSPFNNVYGLARTFLAFSTLVSLSFTPADLLFKPLGTSMAEAGFATQLGQYGLFALLNDRLELARAIAIALLCVVASGWRPRLTGVIHWWVSWSFFYSMVTQDGGDQCVAVLTLLLIPVTLCDARSNHWRTDAQILTKGAEVRARIAASALAVARLQVAFLYLHAAVGKTAVREWANGTAVYYWLLDTRIGFATEHHDIALALLEPAWSAPLLTWLPMALEFALFASLSLSSVSPARPVVFWIAVLFHVGNIVFFGLVSFMLAMTGALILLLRPWSKPYVLSLSSGSLQTAARLVSPLLPRKRRVGSASTSQA